MIDPAGAGGAPVLFEPLARPLLLLHAATGLVAVGAATLFSARAALDAARGRAGPGRSALLAPLAVAAQVLLGLALYPTYRVRVRLADFDRAAPALAQLFDFKEHLAALGLALVVAAAFAARAPGAAAGPRAPGDRDRAARWTVFALAMPGAALVWGAALIGLVVSARHPLVPR